MGRPDSTVSAAVAEVPDGAVSEAMGYGDGVVTATVIAELDGADGASARGAQPSRDLSPDTGHRELPADAVGTTDGFGSAESFERQTWTESSSFSAWSRRYTVRLMLLDGLMGMLAVISTAVFFPHIISFSTPKLAVLILGAGMAWPIAVAISRGYERTKIGVGGDEMRAVMRAVVVAIAAGAVPSAVTERPGVVALCVMATPIAGAG